MAAFGPRALYGGAITVDLPQDYIDASDIQQIPSHQEVFLSPTSLTSIIVELNSSISAPNDEASTIHFHDPIMHPDSGQIVGFNRCTLNSNTMARYPAYLVTGEIASYERHAPAAVKVKSWLLLIRIEDKSTDMCVRMSMPLREFDHDSAQKEEALVEEAMERIRQSLNVQDFNLFVD